MHCAILYDGNFIPKSIQHSAFSSLMLTQTNFTVIGKFSGQYSTWQKKTKGKRKGTASWQARKVKIWKQSPDALGGEDGTELWKSLVLESI